MTATDKEDTSQYLTFQLGSELFAIEVVHVREVLEFIKITSVPGSPEYLKGMINVRGNVIPVMSLHVKIGLEEQAKSVNTRIIVTELLLGDENIVLGIVADAVKEVLDIREKEIEPPPRIGNRYNKGMTKGIVTRKSDFIIILNLEACAISCENLKADFCLPDTAEDTAEKDRPSV